MAEGVRRKISAILSADVVGYSKLMEADEETTVRTMESYRTSVSSLIEQHNGRVVDSPGDNLLAEFGSVVDAAQCAVEIQHVIRAKNAVVPEARRMEFRIGISLEDVIEEGDRIYGDGVNIASRIEGLADAGGICVSGAAYEQIKRKLALGYEDLGEHSVKNISWPVQVYRIPTESRGATEPRRDRVASSTDKPSIAVLPFDNMSPDPEQEYFSDGMTEEIISRLSMNAGIAVIARNSTFFYKGKQIGIRQIGQELDARYVVEGSVRKAGNRIRIAAQLIDATSDSHLWTETYDQELRDIFALQDEISLRIVASLNVTYQEAELERVKRIPTDNLSAYENFLRGLEIFYRVNREAVDRGRGFLQKAIGLDPDYADAIASLGYSYYMDYYFQWGQADSLEEALKCASKAIALDASCWRAHWCMANTYYAKGQYEKASVAYDRWTSLIPNHDLGYMAKGWMLSMVEGRYEAGMELMRTAIRLNPHPPAHYLLNLGWVYRLMGQSEKAVELQEEALTLDPDDHYVSKELAILYSEMGRDEEARTVAAEILKLEPGFSVKVYGDRAGYKDRALAERDMAALRKAGLK